MDTTFSPIAPPFSSAIHFRIIIYCVGKHKLELEMLIEENQARTTRVKHMDINSRVSGKFGDFIPAKDGSRRCKRARLFGTIIAAVDYNRYRVLFDNNEVKECYSNSLRVEAATASLPPDLPPLPQIGTHHEDEEPDPDQPEDGEEENLEHLPSHDAGEEEEAQETVEEAEGGEAEVEEPAAGQVEGEQQLPVGQLPNTTEVNQPNYHERKRQALEKIRGLLGEQVTIRQGNNSIVWTVIADYDNGDNLVEVNGPSGLKNIDEIRAQPSSIRLCKIFFSLIFGDTFKSKLQKMNNYLKEQRNSKCKVFSETEFLTGIGLIIGAAEFSQQGKDLFYRSDEKKMEEDDDDQFSSMVPHPNFQRFMSYTRFKDFRRFLPMIWWDDERKENGDEWWKFSGTVFKIFCLFSF